MNTDLALKHILAEGEEAARHREQTAFDTAAGPAAGRIVLMGAGGLGRATAAGLKTAGVTPLAFADNNPALWGTGIDGIPVLSPQDAAKKHGQDAVFVVTVYSPGAGRSYADFEAQLNSLGCARVSWFVPLYWKHPDLFLPHFLFDLPHKIFDDPDAVRAGYAAWHDEASRREYVAQLRLRAFGTPRDLPPLDPHVQYLLDDLFRLDADDVFVDCGAYDGDTAKDLFAHPGASVKTVVSIEADPANFRKLSCYRDSLSEELREKMVLKNYAVWSERTTLQFAATGDGVAMIAESGMVSVQAAPLDEILDGLAPTYIKMDIEGAEPDALTGAAQALTGAPILAVCVYHRQDHLWQLPLQMQALSDRYSLFLRSHQNQGLDTVCYAVPRHRLL